MSLTLHLKDAGETLVLGEILARGLARTSPPPSLLLQGGLGSGKTTLVRGLVESLPGSRMAEVSSPSFNIFNLYPTRPPVAHFDLYRLEGMAPDDALFEFMENPATLTVVEWIEFLDRELWPADAIVLEWLPADAGRRLVLRTMGETAGQLVADLADDLKPYMEQAKEQ